MEVNNKILNEVVHKIGDMSIMLNKQASIIEDNIIPKEAINIVVFLRLLSKRFGEFKDDIYKGIDMGNEKNNRKISRVK
uniref:Uncharacterized protein n=1 Tax=viral metagenome TaxID=1070528 RepID=A0A6M3KQI0_9ZZZZ